MVSSVFRIFGRGERRQDARIRVPSMRVDIDGIKYRTRDWSMSGFRIGHCHMPLRAGDRVAGRLRLPAANGEGDFVAEVVWLSPAGEIGLMLKEVTPRVLIAMGALAGH